ncbi:hypothetical protein [Prevotella brunnea]|uniref:hypothetical protein n=2 Tax=Prevotella TaxID=838 RepID=UPI00283A98FF|nr:hypothetical protein [Prevotella brunnea]
MRRYANLSHHGNKLFPRLEQFFPAMGTTLCACLYDGMDDEPVIGDGHQFDMIGNYIFENPARWQQNIINPNLLMSPIRIQPMINRRLMANIRPARQHEITLQKPRSGHAL